MFGSSLRNSGNRVVVVGALAFALAGCQTAPVGNGDIKITSPHSVMVLESLLDSSSEVVSIHLVSQQNVEDINKWLLNEVPVSAVVRCYEESPYCGQVEEMLRKLNVPFEKERLALGTNSFPHVDLMFDRFVSQTCSDPAHNLAFGCAVSTNTLSVMTDRKQLLSPLVLAPMDAATAVGAIQQRYLVSDDSAEMQVAQ